MNEENRTALPDEGLTKDRTENETAPVSGTDADDRIADANHTETASEKEKTVNETSEDDGRAVAAESTDGEDEDDADTDSVDSDTVNKTALTENTTDEPASVRDAGHAEEYDPDHPRRTDMFFDFVELFMIALTAILLITTFLFRHSVVDGGSMENTLHDGDHLIILSAFYTPEPGDIIVCEDYTIGERLKKPLVKRVIATEGQTVKIVSDREVYVDGVRLTEDYIMINGISSYRYPIECTVSPGCIFVMGDHRNNSTDSREFGEISTDSVLGKAVLRFYPFSDFGIFD